MFTGPNRHSFHKTTFSLSEFDPEPEAEAVGVLVLLGISESSVAGCEVVLRLRCRSDRLAVIFNPAVVPGACCDAFRRSDKENSILCLTTGLNVELSTGVITGHHGAPPPGFTEPSDWSGEGWKKYLLLCK